MLTTAQYRKIARDAEDALDWRVATINYTRAIDAYPNIKGGLAKKDINDLTNARTEVRHQLLHTCAVCGGTMHDTLCPDDISRPFCQNCKSTYTPIGYMNEDDYAARFTRIAWHDGEVRTIVEVVP